MVNMVYGIKSQKASHIHLGVELRGKWLLMFKEKLNITHTTILLLPYFIFSLASLKPSGEKSSINSWSLQ